MKTTNSFDDDKDKKKSSKSISRKKKRGQRHHVKDIMNELKSSPNMEDYYDYIDEIEEK